MRLTSGLIKIMIQIYSYLDYRKYLKDVFKEKKKENKNFSHRSVLLRMNIKSTGYLANILSGKRSINISTTVKLGRILNMSKAEINYFKKLVYFDRSKSIEEKNDHFEQIMIFRKRKIKFLDDEQLSLFSRWYMVLIRELMHCYDFDGDYYALAKLIKPHITMSEAKKAIELLEKINLIVKDDNGIYKPVDNVITTGDEIHSFHVTNFQVKMIELAKFALENIASEDRDISGLTLSISHEKFQLIKGEIQEFRKKISQIAADDSNPEQVYRCNFQFFPIFNNLKKL